MRAGLICLGLIAMSTCGLGISHADGQDSVSYSRDILPILTDNCLACHGPDAAAREADLRLDDPDAAIEYSAWVPGEPDESESILRIFESDPDLIMPPPHSKKELTEEQKELLVKWVEEGANYESHWSLTAPAMPVPPKVADPAWVKNPIDAFVLAKHEELGLSPAPEADRYVLARRVSLDLTGLPPRPEDVLAFIQDTSDNAYETYVDKLLASDRWGEHRARYWLDAARYADTHGIHFDNFREIWAYRDWVIKSFNQNMPYDQFTIENLAGDLLPNPTLDQRIASGFNRCNITTNEGGAISEEYLVLYTRDRTETVAKVWLGYTANCAVCHDHKFDALTQKDFYSLSAFFNNTTQAAMDGNIKDTPPVLAVPRIEDRDRWDALQAAIPKAIDAKNQRRVEARTDYDAWLATATPEQIEQRQPREGMHFRAPLDGGPDAKLGFVVEGSPGESDVLGKPTWQMGPFDSPALQPQGAAAVIPSVGDYERDQPFSISTWVKLPANDGAAALFARMETSNAFRGWDLWVQQRRAGMHLIHRWPDDALKVVAKNQIPANEWTHVTVTYDGSQKANGVKVYYNGVPQPTNVEADRLSGKTTTRTETPFKIGQREQDGIISGTTLSDIQIFSRRLSPGEAQALALSSRFASILAKPGEQRTEEEKNQLFNWWVASLDKQYPQLSRELEELEGELATIRGRGTIAHVMQEKSEVPEAYVLFRGEYDQRRDQVGAATPGFLPLWPDDFPKNRLGLARWLLLPSQPLTTRVTVNRYWQQIFGTGIVATANDFGVTGEMPSHPELLDWLAIDFREHGWDIKRFFKQVVMSSTYRQSAQVTPQKIEADEHNRWLTRGPRFRMDAEMVRDYALSASGLMSPQIGGPSVKPYQPPGVWEAVAMIGSNTRNYQADTGDALYRRSMYTFWKRSAPPASMEILNAPSREFCVVQRERTNTPLQALVTLNDTQFFEAARHLAENCMKRHNGDTNEIYEQMAIAILNRPLSETETQILDLARRDYLTHYESNPDQASEVIHVGESIPDESLAPTKLASWTMVANTLFNLDEVLNK